VEREERREVAAVGGDGTEKNGGAGGAAGVDDGGEVFAEDSLGDLEAPIVGGDAVLEKHAHAAPVGGRSAIAPEVVCSGSEKLAGTRAFQGYGGLYRGG